jgi:hypothetical protein
MWWWIAAIFSGLIVAGSIWLWWVLMRVFLNILFDNKW